MKPSVAKKVLELPDECLIALWKAEKNEHYLSLSEKLPDDIITKTIKKMAKDVIDKRATPFQLKNTIRFEYLREEE